MFEKQRVRGPVIISEPAVWGTTQSQALQIEISMCMIVQIYTFVVAKLSLLAVPSPLC